MDSVLIAHWGKRLDAACRRSRSNIQRLHHQRPYGQLHGKIGKDPTAAADIRLVHNEFASRIDVGEHAPAEVHSA